MSAPAFITSFVEGLPAEDAGRLREVLGLGQDASVETVARQLAPYAQASLAEYIDQFIGRAIPSRIRDSEQLRLLHIARYAFGGRLPDPDTVADLFQKSVTEARTLLRNTATRYRYELARNMNEAVWALLLANTTSAGGDRWNVEVRDLALLEHMHEAVRRGPGNPTGIHPVREEMHIYLIDKPTMESLLAHIGRDYEAFADAVGG